MNNPKVKKWDELSSLTLEKNQLPTDEQLRDVSRAWKEAVDSPYRLQADADFIAGAIWGINLMRNRKE